MEHELAEELSSRVNINNNTCLTTLYSWLPGWAGTRKVKPVCIY